MNLPLYRPIEIGWLLRRHLPLELSRALIDDLQWSLCSLGDSLSDRNIEAELDDTPECHEFRFLSEILEGLSQPSWQRVEMQSVAKEVSR